MLLLETIHSAGSKISSLRARTKSAAIHRMDGLHQSAVFVQIAAWMHSEPICQVTRHFKPDSVDCVTQGALHDALQKVLAEHNLGEGEPGEPSVRSLLKAKFSLLISPLVSPETRRQTGHLIRKLASPKKLEAEIKRLCDQHPVSAGLGATAALALLLVNITPQSNSQSNPQANPQANSVLGQATSSFSATSPATTPPVANPQTSTSPTTAQTSAAPSGIPLSAIEVASVAMPCPISGTSRQAIDRDNGYEYENGAIYYGAISNGQPADGQGTMIYPTGNRYEGDYQNGQRQGCGTFSFVNGRKYIGQFEADQFNGRGTWIIENGERYIGDFKKNQCSGEGTFIFANGSTKSGIWADGKLSDSTLSCDRGSLALPSSQDM